MERKCPINDGNDGPGGGGGFTDTDNFGKVSH